MATPAEVVASAFSQAQTYANLAQSQLTGFTDALNGAIYSPPTISVTWNSIAPPSLPSLPSQPSLPTITYVAPTDPGSFTDEAPPATTIDDFTEVAPDSSELLTNLTATVIARLQGGSGLSPEVEQAIWDRARSRETALALANEDDIARTHEAMGFMLPSGAMADQIRVAQQDYYDKLSSLSREIAIKQADLEQKNRSDAITAATALEGQLISIYQAKAQVYSATVSAKAEIARMGMARYESLIRAYEASVNAFRSKVEAERDRIQALGTQSSALLDGYKAGAQAVESTAKMYAGLWEVQVKDYEASQQVVLQAAKINNDAMSFANSVRVDAAKAGAQVYAQLVSSAYSMIHAGANVSASAGTGVSYNYSGNTNADVSPITSV